MPDHDVDRYLIEYERESAEFEDWREFRELERAERLFDYASETPRKRTRKGSKATRKRAFKSSKSGRESSGS